MSITPGEHVATTETGATFLQRTRKALAGGISGLVAAVAPTVAATGSDGFTAGEGWLIASAAVVGFVGGFAAVFAVPANAA